MNQLLTPLAKVATFVPCSHSAQHYMFVQTLSQSCQGMTTTTAQVAGLCAVHASAIRGRAVDLPVKHPWLVTERSLSSGVRDRDSCSAARPLIRVPGGDRLLRRDNAEKGECDLPSRPATGAASPARLLCKQGVPTLWGLPGRRRILGRAGAECEGVSCDEQLPITLRWSRPLRRRAEQGERLASSGRHAELDKAGCPGGAQPVCTAKAREGGQPPSQE